MSLTLHRARKEYLEGTHRVCAPEETARRIEPLMPGAGVTELKDATDQDRIGIPCFAASRPSAMLKSSRLHIASGITPLHARVTAMMGAIERYAAEYKGAGMECASYEEIGITRAVNPEDLYLPRKLEMGEKVHWTKGWDLLNSEEAYVPSNAVFHPYNPIGEVKPLFPSDTLGLSSGNVPEEAILHALLEIAGCDAMSQAEQHSVKRKSLAIEGSGKARELLDRYEEAGIEVYTWVIEGRCGLPTVLAAADDTVTRDPLLLVMSSGTHTDPEIAAIEALVKVARNRMVQLLGCGPIQRNLLIQQIGYERMKRFNREWFQEGEQVALGDLESCALPDIDQEILQTLGRMGEHTDRVIACDLSAFGIPVFRLVVPRFEVSYIHRGRDGRARR